MAQAYRMTAERTDRPADHAQLVDLINHELRTPLAVLVGHMELFQDLALNLPEAAEHSLAAIARAGERLLTVAATFSQLVDLERAASECPCAASGGSFPGVATVLRAVSD